MRVLSWGTRHPSQRVAMLLFGVAAVDAVVVPRVVFRIPWAHDYRVYFVAARVGWQDGWNAIYDLGRLQQVWHQVATASFYPFLNPPPLAWMVGPLALLPWEISSATWLVLCATAALAASQLVSPPGLGSHLLCAASALTFPPLLVAIRDGQVVVLVLLALSGGTWLLRARRDTLAGIVLGAVCLKPHLLVLVPLVLLLAGRRRATVAMLGTIALIGLLSAASLGSDGIRAYAHALQVAGGFKVQHERSIMWLAGGSWLPIAIEAGTLALTVVALRVNRRQSLEILLSVGLIGSLLVSPYTNSPDLSLLVVPFWLLLGRIPAAEAWIAMCLWLAINVVGEWPVPTIGVELLALSALSALALLPRSHLRQSPKSAQ